MTYRTRFAPSPTGPLHLGHAYCAILGFERAQAHQGGFLLRIEDTDRSRCKPQWEARICDDLHWLGLTWPRPVRRQSAHLGDYRSALTQLADRGLIFPCSCSRGDIRAALSAPQEGAPLPGPDGQIYPGTCRQRPMTSRKPGDALRLNMARALDSLDDVAHIGFCETGPIHPGHHHLNADTLCQQTGDIVLARKDIDSTSYVLAAVCDDAAQQITEVVRGADLFAATYVQVLLQALLGLPTPAYHHHRLIRDATGKRLAKRDDAHAIATYRAEGATPADVRAMIGL